ncbi:phage tail protein [Corallococcus sp. H22C18031201]|uniref:phage tail protein n=1 Tax=Citreicoccus inhibens TaxID=2849499 RepID=UPI000E7271EA|nr:tail fiber protein [Citreicoccus inhibens]MBU8895692.1 tail fiber protein [Citreicoccus inhibens]RJS20118.1 phage tail protein [Corallococcus sp. H22C18031201]
MSDPFIGEIRMFGGNFAPRGWAFCNGQLLSIAQNSALFSILGITYGGNGQTTFALPDLRGRSPMQWGQGPGLSPRTLGEQGGTETVTLVANQMPAHTHSLVASVTQADAANPEGMFNAIQVDSSTQQPVNMYNATAGTTMSPQAIGIAGGSQPHNNMAPYLCVSFIIALQGVYPSRN